MAIRCRVKWMISGVELLAASLASGAAGDPTFSIGGHDMEAARLGEMLGLHLPGARARCALWDTWLPMSTVWAATGGENSAGEARAFYRDVLMRRPIDDEGYVSMQQHRGMAHSEGWPFPGWQQSAGQGWHFSLKGDEWAVQNFRQRALTSADGWGIEGAVLRGVDSSKGLTLEASADEVELTTPRFACDTVVAPFIRLEWGRNSAREGQAWIEWRLEGEEEWPAGRRVTFPAGQADDGMGFANVPLHRHPEYRGMLTQLRIGVPSSLGERVVVKSVITAIDTRHPVTNSAFIQAATDYFEWTTDVAFLRARVGEMRRALRYALEEFDVRTGHHVRVPWVGHDGRSGLGPVVDGKRELRPGVGVGNNYWDLLPFGGQDAYATMQLYVALRRLAALEREVASQPDWGVALAGDDVDAKALDALADAVRDDFRKRFWNPAAGRFVGWIDVEGDRHDYGFTFLNTEAIHHGLATPEQEAQVFSWLDGGRMVEGDTSQAADIFHWRFGPRSTTRRNTETYVWAWSSPESIPWGNQVQDGGAVLGFTYFELMARLKAQGPDAAWRRLREVLAWFGEVQAEGGYRAYYAKPGRGTLQGGGPPGGLGFDHEFMESVLVPQVMLYGFFGAKPRPGGLELAPQLPAAWPSATIDGVHAQAHVFAIDLEPKAVRLTARTAGNNEFALWLPAGSWEMTEMAEGSPATAEGGSQPRHEFGSGRPPWRLRWEAGQTRRFRRL
ncbi:MAG: hypothetical protein ACKV19_10295 [Verrucomicrobiales bacterium]